MKEPNNETLLMAAAMETANKRLDGKNAIAVPSNFSVIKTDHFEKFRDQFKAVFRTDSLAAFEGYAASMIAERLPGTKSIACFLSPGDTGSNESDPSATIIFDIGSPEQPGHALNRAILKPEKTAPYKNILRINGHKTEQEALAEWIQDWSDFIIPQYAENIQIMDTDPRAKVNHALHSIRNIKISTVGSNESKSHELGRELSSMEKIDAQSNDTSPLPIGFLFTCKPYTDIKEMSFSLRLSVIIPKSKDSDFYFVLRIIAKEESDAKVLEEYKTCIQDTFGDKSGVDVIIGNINTD